HRRRRPRHPAQRRPGLPALASVREAEPARAAMLHAREAGSGAVVADRLRVAETHWTRLKGLLGTATLATGEGLWIRPCRQVHMIGMRYPVDVAFLDDEHRVVRAIAGLPPGRISPRVPAATSVLELPTGTLERVGLTEGAR